MPAAINEAWQLGAFALESDLIEPRQLIAAVAAWTDDPARPLVNILVEQESLRQEDLPLLQALWLLHDPAGGRPTSPLALDETAGALPLSADDERVVCDGDREGPIALGDAAGFGGRFRIERELAAGGLGTVSVARDPFLNRVVALKQLKPCLRHHPAGQARFQREAEITGALEHPAIVPLYESGVGPDGAPWYAMRMLGDETLRDHALRFHQSAAASGGFAGFEFRRLLGAFVSACQGIAFAHTRGIIHRDLKPANIVMGDHGEAVVIDWGLAKRTNGNDRPDSATPESGESELLADWPDAGLTVEGGPIGTPGFMSPEQARGRLDGIGQTSDVFGLGATLYFLLAGQAPYSSGDSGTTLGRAAECDFVPPRTIQPTVPPALEAVCLKAMRADPHQRYASVDELRADLERWLADEPVSVFAEPLAERWFRFARRNRSLVGLAAAALLVIATTATVFSLLLGRQVRLVDRARGEAVTLAEEKGRLLVSVEAARVEAESQRRLALRTLRSLVFDVQRQLAPIATAQTVRANILATALEGLRDISASVRDASEVNRNTMVANNELGKIFLHFGGAEGTEATQLALEHFELARRIAEGLVRTAGPDDLTARQDLSIAWELVGDARIELGQLELAGTAFQSALDVTRELQSRHPDSPAVLRDLGFGWEKIGDYHFKRGDLAAASTAFAEGKAAFQSLLALDPDNPVAQRDYCVALQKQGNHLSESGDLAAAEAAFSEALELVQLAGSSSGDVFQPRDELVLRNKLGAVLQKLSRPTEALGCFSSGLGLARQIHAAATDSRQALRDLSISLKLVGDCRLEETAFAAARELYAESLQLREDLFAEDPSSHTARSDLALILERMGSLEKQAGEDELAQTHFRRALEILTAPGQGSLDSFAEVRTLREQLEASLGN
jgi:serine/threonine protein kinase/tetratricopeptide (TPR) repeat protein